MQGSKPTLGFASEPLRYDALDCLRGIAACTVVICHTIMLGLFRVEPVWSHVKWTPLRLMWSGHQAVILFFVLSGFSLSILFKSLQPTPGSTPRFLLARWLRLYPVYALSLLFASISYSLLASAGIPWPDSALYVPSPDVPAHQLWLHFTLVVNFNTALINPPAWSIVHEMRISIIFPLIVWLVGRLRFGAGVIAGLGSVAVSIGCWDIPQSYGTQSIALSALSTLHYCTFFIVGALIAQHRVGLIAWARRYSAQKRIIVLAIALALYGYGYDETWTSGQIMLGDLVVGAGAAAIVLLVIAFPVLNRSRFLLYLGKISYSLYLVHFTCFGIVSVLFHRNLPLPVLWGMVIALSLAVAHIGYWIVERPALKWSRAVRPQRPTKLATPAPTIAPNPFRPPV